jgi:hypothetical protein
MPMTLPEGAPATLGEAFARINAVHRAQRAGPEGDGAGRSGRARRSTMSSAEGTDHPEVKRLLIREWR